MHRVILLLFSSLTVLGQQQLPPQTTNIPNVPINVGLSETVSTKTSQVGDIIHLELLLPVVNETGQVIIPRGARLTAVVTVSSPKEGKRPARWSLKVTRAEWEGSALPMNAFISGSVMIAFRDPARPYNPPQISVTGHTEQDRQERTRRPPGFERSSPDKDGAPARQPVVPAERKGIQLVLSDESVSELRSEHKHIELPARSTFTIRQFDQ